MESGQCTTEVLFVEHGPRYLEAVPRNVATKCRYGGARYLMHFMQCGGGPVPWSLPYVNHNSANCSLSGKNRIIRAEADDRAPNRGDRVFWRILKLVSIMAKGPARLGRAHIIKSGP